jgi:diketogulonate reductase-like aldo/keto reductase
MTAYGPIGSPGDRSGSAMRQTTTFNRPKLLEDETVKEIAARYRKTPAQVLLRWLIQRGIAVIPKSINAERIRENFDVFDFSLDETYFNKMSNLPIRERLFGKREQYIEHPFHVGDDFF